MLREAVLSDFPGCFRLINTDFDYEPADILWRTSECGEHKSIYRIIITLKGKAVAHDAFLKSAELAQALGVDKADVLCTVNDIDDFFMN